MNAKNFRLSCGGALTGLANGLFGGGGGMLAVPLLENAGLHPQPAHATAIAVILPVSFVSALVYLFMGSVPLAVLLPVLCGVVAGGAVGAKLLSVISPRRTVLLFALVMLAAGLRMLF